MNKYLRSCVYLTSTLSIVPTLVSAATIEEVVVTAQKKEEGLQEAPLAVTAFDNQSMESMGIVDFSGIAVASPSITYTVFPSSSNTLILFMRGQGAADPGQITKEASVGMYIDGVYMARPQGMTMDLADVEQIEVLRGPQGTLYGRNTTGGAVNIVTKKPSGEFHVKEHLTFGNRGKFRSLTMVDLPAMGDVSAKVSYIKNKKDGYVDNPGGNDYGLEDQQGGRLALRWDVNEATVVDYTFENGSFESTPIYYQNTMGPLVFPSYSLEPHTTAYRPADLDISDTDVESHSLTVAVELSDSLLFKSISAYREMKVDINQDYLDAFFLNYSFYKATNDMESRQWSQEFQISGDAFDDKLDYVGGLYYFEESSNQHYFNNLGGLLSPFGGAPFYNHRRTDLDSTSWAAYFQATYTPEVLDSRLSVTGGLRYTNDKRSGYRTKYLDVPAFTPSNIIPLGTVENDVDYESVDPSLTISYDWNSEINSYLRLATAYKSGGFSESGTDFGLDFDPESLSTVELGLKSYWFDRKVRFNTALFWNDYKDMQLDLTPDPQQISVTNTYNAGSATIEGVEVELFVYPVDELKLFVDYTYLHATIDEVKNPISGADITANFALPYAPKHAYHVGFEYTVGSLSFADVTFRADYNWQDEIYLSSGISNDPARQKAWTRDDFGTLDARLTFDLKMDSEHQVRVALWGKNIENKQYQAHVLTTGFGNSVAWNEPKSYGLDFIYEY